MWCLNIEFAVSEQPALELSGFSPVFKMPLLPLVLTVQLQLVCFYFYLIFLLGAHDLLECTDLGHP